MKQYTNTNLVVVHLSDEFARCQFFYRRVQHISVSKYVHILNLLWPRDHIVTQISANIGSGNAWRHQAIAVTNVDFSLAGFCAWEITATSPRGQWVNSLGPSDAIWRQRSGSTLAQVMACCLTAPSHYLHQCWLIISKVDWHSSKGKFTRDNSPINHWNYLENQVPRISFKFPRGQWVKLIPPGGGLNGDSDATRYVRSLDTSWFCSSPFVSLTPQLAQLLKYIN